MLAAARPTSTCRDDRQRDGTPGARPLLRPGLPRGAVKILPGQYHAAGGEGSITTVLGSCVSTCLWDPLLRVGGMNHFMLPGDPSAAGSPWGVSARFGVYAMELLINGSEGYACIGAFNNAETALEKIPQLLPNVVLMDFNLPGMNGIECIARLKAEFPDMQFMMLTVYEDDDKIFMALEAGASGYILKKTSPATCWTLFVSCTTAVLP